MESPEQEQSLEPAEHMTGHCMCGKVRFEIDQPLIGMALCYCKRCQRRTGTAFSATGLTRPGSFTVTSGEEHIGIYDPGDGGFQKAFCRECGGGIHTRHPENPDILAVRVGTLDQDPGIRPMAHQFTAYAAPWYPVPDDGLPNFPERLDWTMIDL